MLFKSSLIIALATLIAGKKECHGPRGDQGYDGPTGIPGQQGAKGDTGATGPEGLIGQGSAIYCSSLGPTALTIPENVAVPFQTCVQTKGFVPLESFGLTRMIQVEEAGDYQITFYAIDAAVYRVFINGNPIESYLGGVFDGTNNLYTPGLYATYLPAGSVVSVNAVGTATMSFLPNWGVSTSILIQRIADYIPLPPV